jgi:hypothetical protein
MQTEASNGPRKWARRAGIIAFLFFLGKGLVWLGLAAAGVYLSLN